MPLTPAQHHVRRFGPPGAINWRTAPRNPLGVHSDWVDSPKPLAQAEWSALRTWQRREIKRWTYEPSALARKKALMAALAAGTAGVEATYPEPPPDSNEIEDKIAA